MHYFSNIIDICPLSGLSEGGLSALRKISKILAQITIMTCHACLDMIRWCIFEIPTEVQVSQSVWNGLEAAMRVWNGLVSPPAPHTWVVPSVEPRGGSTQGSPGCPSLLWRNMPGLGSVTPPGCCQAVPSFSTPWERALAACDMSALFSPGVLSSEW